MNLITKTADIFFFFLGGGGGELQKFGVKMLAHCRGKIQSHFYLGDLVICTGDWEICSISGRLPDNLGELQIWHM